MSVCIGGIVALMVTVTVMWRVRVRVMVMVREVVRADGLAWVSVGTVMRVLMHVTGMAMQLRTGHANSVRDKHEHPTSAERMLVGGVAGRGSPTAV
jgi:hypothetical protein